ncbi:MAG: DNA primase [Acidobacteriota bacterium]
MDFVEQLKSSIDIVKVIGEYVRLERKGATGRYSGLCPFHQEKTPSFSVNQARQFYHCFGCQVHGDVIKFVMEHDGMTFPEALQFLAERNGIPMPKRSEYSDVESRLKNALFEMHTIAADTFRENLRGAQGAEARAYLERRGISEEVIQTFDLGFSDPAGQALTRRFAERFSAEQLEASGLVRRRDTGGHYDAFRGRLMFPIHNEAGKVIAFGGRAMRDEDQPKYLNSPETPIYKKTSVLYNLHRARDTMRKNQRAVLVEGYMDVIGVYAADIKEAVASCGTALTNAQVRAMHRHADSVVLNFDPDTAGENAAERAIQLLLDEGLHVRVVSLSGGSEEAGAKLDPDEFVKRFGGEAYRAKVDHASGYFHWMADRARVKFDMRTAEGKMAAFKFLLPAVQKVPDKLERAAVANDLAGYLGVDPSMVLDQFKKAATERSAGSPPSAPKKVVPATERILLQAMLASLRVRQEILPALTPEMLETFLTREIFEALGHVEGEDPARIYAALEGRLGDADRALLHEALAADDIGDEEMVWSQAEACLFRVQGDFRKRHLADLKARVKLAAREGRASEALELNAELDRLEKEQRRRAS